MADASYWFDYVFVQVHDLEQAVADFERFGFSVAPGGLELLPRLRTVQIPFADGFRICLVERPIGLRHRLARRRALGKRGARRARRKPGAALKRWAYSRFEDPRDGPFGISLLKGPGAWPKDDSEPSEPSEPSESSESSQSSEPLELPESSEPPESEETRETAMVPSRAKEATFPEQPEEREQAKEPACPTGPERPGLQHTRTVLRSVDDEAMRTQILLPDHTSGPILRSGSPDLGITAESADHGNGIHGVLRLVYHVPEIRFVRECWGELLSGEEPSKAPDLLRMPEEEECESETYRLENGLLTFVAHEEFRQPELFRLELRAGYPGHNVELDYAHTHGLRLRIVDVSET